MTKGQIIDNLRKHIINDLYRENMTPEEIGADMPLFEDEGIGLDSLDAVELAMIIEKDYGLIIEDGKEAKEIFRSLSSLANHILASRSGQ